MAVAIKLKGAAGSFRSIDDRPSFTIHASKYERGGRWRGLAKFHLNNSVQDDTLACEAIGARLFAAAGIPTPRAGHARVRLNGRDLGLYVVKEGFDVLFLRRHFADATGNLYDGGFVRDLDAPLERDEGKGPDDKGDLRALVAACREPDPGRRTELLERLVDIERFITLMAMELMMGHWDGYTQNRNNYRIYFDPSTGKAHILPHGLDQIFQNPGFGILQRPGTILAAAVMGHPAWRRRYRERIGELLPLFEPGPLHAVVDEIERKLAPAQKAIGERAASRHANRIRNLKSRISARYESLVRQNGEPEPFPIAFDGQGIARLSEWRAVPAANAELRRVETDDLRKALWIRGAGGGPPAGSWRRRVLLAKGAYWFEASVRTEEVVPVPDPRGSGAGLRISGEPLANPVSGSSDWTVLRHRIEIREQMREVELVLELRASSGAVWFDEASLLLRQAE